MKKNIISLCLLFSSFQIFAQVSIGKSGLSNTSVSLEFGDYVAMQGKGIIVPWVNNAVTMTSEKGTIVFDANDKIMKYKKADGTWFRLSKNEITTLDGDDTFNTMGVVDTSLQSSQTELPLAKVSIGKPTSTPGILVLEDDNKAMILPKVPKPYLNVANPEPGTMVYDTDSDLLAIFNGKVWSFWKATP